MASRPSRSVVSEMDGTGRAVPLETEDGDGDEDSGGGVGVGLREPVRSTRGGTGRCARPMSESSTEGVIDEGGAEVGDEDVELSGEEIGDDVGHEGEVGISIIG